MTKTPPNIHNHPTKYSLPGTRTSLPGYREQNPNGPDFWFHMSWHHNHGSDSYFHVPHVYTINLPPKSRRLIPFPRWNEVHANDVKTGKWFRMEDRYLDILKQELRLPGDEVGNSSPQTSSSEASGKGIPFLHRIRRRLTRQTHRYFLEKSALAANDQFSLSQEIQTKERVEGGCDESKLI